MTHCQIICTKVKQRLRFHRLQTSTIRLTNRDWFSLTKTIIKFLDQGNISNNRIIVLFSRIALVKEFLAAYSGIVLDLQYIENRKPQIDFF